VAVLSHDPKLDDPALFGALQSDARFIGAIGSPKTQRERRERLAAAGISAEQLKRLHGPIGLDIGAQSPEEIGVAILAQIIAAKGGKLAAAPERARAVAAAVS
jgi:xanthine dehydrogenase accessory factor